MAKFHTDKNGIQRWKTNRRDIPAIQRTVQGEPINNHQGRLGTVKMKRGRCHCEICRRNTKEAKEKIAKKDFEKDKKEI